MRPYAEVVSPSQRGLGQKKEIIMGYGWNINTLNQGNEKNEVHSILEKKTVRKCTFS